MTVFRQRDCYHENKNKKNIFRIITNHKSNSKREAYKILKLSKTAFVAETVYVFEAHLEKWRLP